MTDIDIQYNCISCIFVELKLNQMEDVAFSPAVNRGIFQVSAEVLWLQWARAIIRHHEIIENIYWFQLSLYCVREWMEVKWTSSKPYSLSLCTPMYWNDSNNGLHSSDEYKFCITWTPFQTGQICVTTLCCSVCESVCSSGRVWQGTPCRQLKLLINALLDNTQANPIIWQAVIRAFASLTACLSVCESAGSRYAISSRL